MCLVCLSLTGNWLILAVSYWILRAQQVVFLVNWNKVTFPWEWWAESIIRGIMIHKKDVPQFWSHGLFCISVTAVGKRHNIKFLAFFLSNTGLLNKLWLCWFVPALLQWSLWSLTELFYAKWKYLHDFLIFRDKDISIKCKLCFEENRSQRYSTAHHLRGRQATLKSMSYV